MFAGGDQWVKAEAKQAEGEVEEIVNAMRRCDAPGDAQEVAWDGRRRMSDATTVNTQRPDEMRARDGRDRRAGRWGACRKSEARE